MSSAMHKCLEHVSLGLSFPATLSFTNRIESNFIRVIAHDAVLLTSPLK
jgi:hypothetical protein